jgi:protein TonB
VRAKVVVASAFPDQNSQDEFSGLRGRSRRLLALAVALSLGLHLALLGALPRVVNEPPPPHVLEVVLVRPEALPLARTEPSPAPERREPEAAPPPRKPEPKRKPQAKVEKPSQHETVRRDAPSSASETPTGDTTAAAAQAPVPAEPKPLPPSSPASPPVASPAKPPLTPPAFSASYLRNPAPRYPTAARRNGEQGTVTLRVLVTREGAPARVTVEQTSGSRHLDTAALEAVKTWRFVPARQGTEPVDAWVLVPIVFRLEDAS